MRFIGASNEAHLFVYLHDYRCQPKHKKSTKETLNFGNVNFQPKTLRLMYVLVAAV